MTIMMIKTLKSETIVRMTNEAITMKTLTTMAFNDDNDEDDNIRKNMLSMTWKRVKVKRILM